MGKANIKADIFMNLKRPNKLPLCRFGLFLFFTRPICAVHPHFKTPKSLKVLINLTTKPQKTPHLNQIQNNPTF